MSAPTSTLHVVIIGAGTGGLCLAHGLKRAGVSVAVYERDATRADGLQGYRVGINPDGTRALRDCLPPDLYATFLATCARPPEYVNFLTEGRKEVLSLDGFKSDDAVDSEKSVSRMTLRQVLLTGLQDIVHFGKTFKRYRTNDDGSVTAFFEDGSSVDGTVLVAADGSNSRVRRQYLPHARLEDCGPIGITGKVPVTDETVALLTPKMRRGISMIYAPKGVFCIYHAMEFPWDADGAPKDGIGSSDAELLGQWPGLTFDNTRDYINWGYVTRAKRLPDDTLKMKGPDLYRLVNERTTDWHPDLRKLFELADPNSCFPIKIRTAVPIPQWETTHVTLIGDAIHTMTPGRGVGANTALRDARLLCRMLVAAHEGREPLLAAIRDYETKMIEYGFDAVKESRKSGGGTGPDQPFVGRILLAALRTTMRVVNHLPALKRRLADSDRSYRGHGRED
ncbi:FAD-dependent monooxygenase [Streptomyces sp. So13.3]|uniref:FAD-dependent oxidoreductase n=1 Tax=Streptomyces TaxID=1883 RepID=UPI0011073F20|nr:MULTISPECIES: NAD(P)/FAD-dependent oxidoreductase [Streptomyces]MCZ4097848.1 NAD(P)/FAD-dependent oxidoreductase [Streptomyces sp. H39-C1]QNA76744.1 FAD-dependent monooxygenase [Streptomyces sp. So13.3]